MTSVFLFPYTSFLEDKLLKLSFYKIVTRIGKCWLTDSYPHLSQWILPHDLMALSPSRIFLFINFLELASRMDLRHSRWKASSNLVYDPRILHRIHRRATRWFCVFLFLVLHLSGASLLIYTIRKKYTCFYK